MCAFVAAQYRGVQRHPPATQNASQKSSAAKNKEVWGQNLPFVSGVNERIKPIKRSNKCVDAYVYSALKLTYKHL